VWLVVNLALFLNIRFYFDGRTYTADERYYQFWTSLARYFEKVVLCVPVVMDHEMRGNFDVDLKANHVEICRLPVSSPFDIHKLPRVSKIISENIHRWDIVGAVVPNLTGNLFLHLAKQHKRPYFGYVRGNVKKTAWFELKGVKRWGGYAYFWILDVWTRRLIRTGLTFAVGQDLQKAYSKGSNAVHRIVVSVISENGIRSAPPNSFVAGRPRLLHIGRLSSEKGVADLLEAVRILKNKHGPWCQLTVAGSGPEENRLKEYVKALGIDENVRFVGYVKEDAELVRLYQNSDVFILPSYTEGVPKVILEAMANGLPVVSTAVGGIPEIVQDGVNGLLVPPRDPEGIYAAIHRLLKDGELRLRITKSAIETGRMYTLERQGEDVVRLLNGHFKLDLAGR
jgi:glycosyltransferase involved in cell wall biosynthesis